MSGAACSVSPVDSGGVRWLTRGIVTRVSRPGYAIISESTPSCLESFHLKTARCVTAWRLARVLQAAEIRYNVEWQAGIESWRCISKR